MLKNLTKGLGDIIIVCNIMIDARNCFWLTVLAGCEHFFAEVLLIWQKRKF